MQAKNPKDQYLLLKSLNEVIVSISSGATGKELSPAHQQEVCMHLHELCAVFCSCLCHMAIFAALRMQSDRLLQCIAQLHRTRCACSRKAVCAGAGTAAGQL